MSAQRANAENLEQMAVSGRILTRYALFDADWSLALDLAGGALRQHVTSLGPRERGRKAELRKNDDIWVGGRPIRVTLGRDALKRPSDETMRLLELSRLQDRIAIDTADAEIASRYPNTGLVSVEGLGPDAARLHGTLDERVHSAILRTSRETTTARGMIVDGNFPGFVAQRVQELGGHYDTGQKFGWEFEAHRTLGNDILVTESSELLRHRHKWPWLLGEGLCAPREALSIIEVLLRSNDLYITHIDDGSLATVDSTLFYMDLAAFRLDEVRRGFSSCLAPGNRDKWRHTGARLEALIARQGDLYLGGQHLALLHQREGFLGGGNDLLQHQMYHLQNGVYWVVGASTFWPQ